MPAKYYILYKINNRYTFFNFSFSEMQLSLSSYDLLVLGTDYTGRHKLVTQIFYP